MQYCIVKTVVGDIRSKTTSGLRPTIFDFSHKLSTEGLKGAKSICVNKKIIRASVTDIWPRAISECENDSVFEQPITP